MRLQPLEIPHDLEESIMRRVLDARNRSFTVRRIMFSLLSCASFVLSIAVSIRLYNALLSSGFFGYVSLGISDFSVLSVIAKELALSLIESIPIATLSLFLVSLTAFLWSGARALLPDRRSLTI